MATGDLYEILGVSREATPDEIQRAYRKLARTYHPDVNKDPGAEERFKEVSGAYDVLSDPTKRERYNAFGEDWSRVPDDVSPEDWARARSGASSGPRTSSRTWSSSDFEEVDFDDIFGSMFGGRRGGWGGPTVGADQEAEIVLTVEDAYGGVKRWITIGAPGGAQRSIEVAIPPGVTDGQRIRLAGQGAQGSAGGKSGDLYLVVRIAQHARYRLDGRNITVDLLVTPWEAALGALVPVDTPGGEAKVKVPPGSSSGRKLRLSGRGLPNPKGKAGDLYAELRIMVPPNPTKDERELFEQLGRVSNFDPRTEKGR
jgi:curved DNA-binding protein